MYKPKGVILENRDIILLITAITVVIGWFAKSFFDRKHEISKLRSECRIATLKSYLLFYIEVQKTKSLDGFNEIQADFLLYGYDDEIKLINEIVNDTTAVPTNPGFLKKMLELSVLARNRLRVELGLPKIKS